MIKSPFGGGRNQNTVELEEELLLWQSRWVKEEYITRTLVAQT